MFFDFSDIVKIYLKNEYIIKINVYNENKKFPMELKLEISFNHDEESLNNTSSRNKRKKGLKRSINYNEFDAYFLYEDIISFIQFNLLINTQTKIVEKIEDFNFIYQKNNEYQNFKNIIKLNESDIRRFKISKQNNDFYNYYKKSKANKKNIKEEKKEEEEKEVLKKEKIIGEKKEINTEDDKIEIPEENKNNQTRVKYYNENISNLTNTITDNITLDLIPDFLKRAFLLNELIYEDDYYFKGTFPKIIVSTKGEEDNIKNIKGLCSFYYENNENLKENIIVRINCIFAIDDDYEEQITLMIDFIKKNVKYNRIELYLLYDKEGDKFIPNKEAKDLFQKKLGFKWLCVVRDEKLQQRYIKLYLDNDSDDEKQKDIENTQNNFIMNNLTIISVNNEDNA
jgi:hypothetical protein